MSLTHDDPWKKMTLFESFSRIPPRAKGLIYVSIPANIAIGYFIVVISAYLPEIGVGADFIGLILAANSVTFVIASIPLGRYADKKGRKNLMIWGMLGIPPILLVYALTTEETILLAAALLGGLTEAAFLATWNAMIADMTTVDTRRAAFSLSFIVGNITFGLGFAIPFAFPFIEDYTGWGSHAVHSGTFLVMFAASLVSPVAAYRLLKDYKETAHEPTKRERSESMKIVLKFSGVNSLIGLGAGFIIPLVPTWLYLKFGVEDAYTGPLLAISNVLMGVSALASTKLAKNLGDVRTIVLTQASSTVFMLSLAFTPNAPLAAGLYLTRAALMNMAIPVADSYLMGIISEKDRGLASAINGITWRLPNSVSTVIGGMLLADGIYDVPFYLATGFYVVSIALFWAVFRNIRPAR